MWTCKSDLSYTISTSHTFTVSRNILLTAGTVRSFQINNEYHTWLKEDFRASCMLVIPVYTSVSSPLIDQRVIYIDPGCTRLCHLCVCNNLWKLFEKTAKCLVDWQTIPGKNWKRHGAIQYVMSQKMLWFSVSWHFSHSQLWLQLHLPTSRLMLWLQQPWCII